MRIPLNAEPDDCRMKYFLYATEKEKKNSKKSLSVESPNVPTGRRFVPIKGTAQLASM